MIIVVISRMLIVCFMYFSYPVRKRNGAVKQDKIFVI